MLEAIGAMEVITLLSRKQVDVDIHFEVNIKMRKGYPREEGTTSFFKKLLNFRNRGKNNAVTSKRDDAKSEKRSSRPSNKGPRTDKDESNDGTDQRTQSDSSEESVEHPRGVRTSRTRHRKDGKSSSRRNR